MRPDLGQVKYVPAELLGLFGRQDLNVTGPAGEIARLDLFEEILSCIIGIIAGEVACGIVVEGLDALIDLEMELDVVERAVFLDEFECMSGITVHMRVSVRGTSIGEQNHNLMNGLGVRGKVIPEHIRILQIGLRIAFLGVNEQWELGWIAKEEHWGVIHNLNEPQLALRGKRGGAHTKSQFPSSVKNLTANPRGSRAVSAEPFSPPTVEKRTSTGVFLPTSEKRSAVVKSEMSSVTSNTPCAPAPLA